MDETAAIFLFQEKLEEVKKTSLSYGAPPVHPIVQPLVFKAAIAAIISASEGGKPTS
jgi:hypothetical protein